MLFALTGLKRNGLGWSLVPNIAQDFGFIRGEGHTDLTPFKLCSCDISQAIILIEIAIEIARLLF